VDQFGLLSHHVIGDVTDTQCEVCHDTSEHMGGTVRLKDPDDPGTTITYTDGASIEGFCLGCHDSDGANGDTTPFDDGGTPTDVAAGWLGSIHGSLNITCAGDGINGCHGSAHGSEKRHLLGPADVPATAPALAEEEEGFCYQCHSTIETEFARPSRHDVAYADQNAHGSKVECTNCHNPHVSTLAQPLIDPDDPWTLLAGNETDFCLACHDGSPPAGVTFPSMSPGSGYDKSRWVGSLHQVTGAVSCGNCHERHGSGEDSLKVARYDQEDFVTYSHGSDQYALCWQCHDEDKTVRTAGGSSADNAFGTRHSLHVRSERSACIMCHDVHFSYDAGEDGLVSYAYPVKQGWSFSLGSQTLSTAFRDTGTNRGSCYLSCHGEGHNPLSYTGVNADTLK
jgi:predicted CXXCH cytochrome family protein